MHCTDRAVSAADGVGGLEQSQSCISVAMELLSDCSIINIHIDTSTAIAVRTYLNMHPSDHESLQKQSQLETKVYHFRSNS